MHVSVDRERCVASGQCNLIAPEVFDQDDVEGLVVITDEHPDASYAGALHEAARICPAQVIKVTAAAWSVRGEGA